VRVAVSADGSDLIARRAGSVIVCSVYQIGRRGELVGRNTSITLPVAVACAMLSRPTRATDATLARLSTKSIVTASGSPGTKARRLAGLVRQLVEWGGRRRADRAASERVAREPQDLRPSRSAIAPVLDIARGGLALRIRDRQTLIPVTRASSLV
jgi:hypothetical protein